MLYISIGNAAMPSISTVETHYNTGAISSSLSLSPPPPPPKKHTHNDLVSLWITITCSTRRTDMRHLENPCISGVSRMVDKE